MHRHFHGNGSLVGVSRTIRAFTPTNRSELKTDIQVSVLSGLYSVFGKLVDLTPDRHLWCSLTTNRLLGSSCVLNDDFAFTYITEHSYQLTVPHIQLPSGMHSIPITTSNNLLQLPRFCFMFLFFLTHYAQRIRDSINCSIFRHNSQAHHDYIKSVPKSSFFTR